MVVSLHFITNTIYVKFSDILLFLRHFKVFVYCKQLLAQLNKLSKLKRVLFVSFPEVRDVLQTYTVLYVNIMFALFQQERDIK